MARSKLFISYSHRDTKWLEQLRQQLNVLGVEGLIEVFDDQAIGPGEAWYPRLNEELASARMAVLLISASFLSSSFIRKEEVPKLLDRHEQGGLTIYPLLVRDCAWDLVPWLKRLQMRPLDAKPISSFRGAARDKCLANVVREIAAISNPIDVTGTINPTMPNSSVPVTAVSSGSPWAIMGQFKPVPQSAPLPEGGSWRLQLHVESIGPGPTVSFPISNIKESNGALNFELPINPDQIGKSVYFTNVSGSYVLPDGTPTAWVGSVPGSTLTVV